MIHHKLLNSLETVIVKRNRQQIFLFRCCFKIKTTRTCRHEKVILLHVNANSYILENQLNKHSNNCRC